MMIAERRAPPGPQVEHLPDDARPAPPRRFGEDLILFRHGSKSMEERTQELCSVCEYFNVFVKRCRIARGCKRQHCPRNHDSVATPLVVVLLVREHAAPMRV